MPARYTPPPPAPPPPPRRRGCGEHLLRLSVLALLVLGLAWVILVGVLHLPAYDARVGVSESVVGASSETYKPAIVATADLAHVAYITTEGCAPQHSCVVYDGVRSAEYEAFVTDVLHPAHQALVVSPNGQHLSYVGIRNHQYQAVIDGQASPWGDDFLLPNHQEVAVGRAPPPHLLSCSGWVAPDTHLCALKIGLVWQVRRNTEVYAEERDLAGQVEGERIGLEYASWRAASDLSGQHVAYTRGAPSGWQMVVDHVAGPTFGAIRALLFSPRSGRLAAWVRRDPPYDPKALVLRPGEWHIWLAGELYPPLSDKPLAPAQQAGRPYFHPVTDALVYVQGDHVMVNNTQLVPDPANPAPPGVMEINDFRCDPSYPHLAYVTTVRGTPSRTAEGVDRTRAQVACDQPGGPWWDKWYDGSAQWLGGDPPHWVCKVPRWVPLAALPPTRLAAAPPADPCLKFALVIDGQVGPLVDELPLTNGMNFTVRRPQMVPAFTRGGQHHAYPARVQDHWVVVRDGQLSAPYDQVDEVTFSRDDQHLIYAAAQSGKWQVYVDGQPTGPVCPLVDTPAGSHLLTLQLVGPQSQILAPVPTAASGVIAVQLAGQTVFASRDVRLLRAAPVGRHHLAVAAPQWSLLDLLLGYHTDDYCLYLDGQRVGPSFSSVPTQLSEPPLARFQAGEDRWDSTVWSADGRHAAVAIQQSQPWNADQRYTLAALWRGPGRATVLLDGHPGPDLEQLAVPDNLDGRRLFFRRDGTLSYLGWRDGQLIRVTHQRPPLAP